MWKQKNQDLSPNPIQIVCLLPLGQFFAFEAEIAVFGFWGQCLQPELFKGQLYTKYTTENEDTKNDSEDERIT